MLHTKFQGHRPSDFREIFKGFTIYGHGGHLDHVLIGLISVLRPFNTF